MSITAVLEGAKDLQATLGEDEVMTAEMDSEGFIAKDGGFYTPSVSNVNENTVEFSFAASEEGMPAVPDVQVRLPQGPKGNPGEPGQPGRDGKDGVVGKDGEPGKDGVSATHSWNGTTLTITSASGTSSANLKGDKGDKGDQGIQGEPGAKGDTGASPTISIEETGSGVLIEAINPDGTQQIGYVLNGAKGDKGDPGSNANVTAASIANALGYTPVKSSGWGANKNLGTDENGNVIEKYDIFSKDVSAWSPVEYMNGVSWTEKGYYWTSNGTHTSTEYTQAYRSTTELIRIEPNCSYTFSKFSGVYFLYDSTGKNGVASTQHTNPNASLTFETNENQYYIGISPHEYLSTGNISLVRNTISEAEYNALPTRADSLKSLYGKTVVCFGDSLFGMHRGDDSTPAFVAAETGATVHNVGFGGCRMSVHPTTGYGAFCMWALAKAIAENNWTTQDEEAAISPTTYFPDQLALLKSIDFSNVDIVVIHYGTNDFGIGSGVALGKDSPATDYTTICGALRYSIEKLLGKYPNLRIYVSLPVYRYWASNGVTTYSDTYTNAQGNTLKDVAEALRGVAAEYNLPVIDSYYGLGINKANAATFLSDGTHHNVSGRERFGRYIGQNLISQQTSGKSGESGESSVGKGLFYIEGDSTTAGAWTGTHNEITNYYDGLVIAYKTNIAGVSGGTTLNINGLGAVSVYRNASTAVTTIYPAGSVLILTYSGGAWLTADYDANTKTTAGTSNKTGTKMYLVGATSQTSSGTTTYTNTNAYIGTDNCLYSGGSKVYTASDLESIVNSVIAALPVYNGEVV